VLFVTGSEAVVMKSSETEARFVSLLLKKFI